MVLNLNKIRPAKGAKKKKIRVGRGIGCGNGKTCGRGHKGQTARSGYGQKIGFEGGQMPLHRRTPKFGFNSWKKKFVEEVRLGELNGVDVEKIDLVALKDANVISAIAKRAKVILSGSIKKPVFLFGIAVTKGARKAIEDAGGRIEE